MTKALRCLALLAAVSALAAAHRPLEAQLTLGINGGYVSSTFYGSDADQVDSRSGFDFGANLAIALGSGRFAVAPGLYLIQKGAKGTEDGASLEIKGTYVEIPVVLAVALTPAESTTSFSIFAGPQVAFESSCDVSVSEGGLTLEASCDDAGFEPRTTTDFGAVFGALVGFPIGERLQLQFSGGADFGMRTLDASTDPDDIKNRAFFLNAGVGIPLGG